MKIKDWFLNFKDYKDMKATVPCSLYCVLLDYSLIKDPFAGENEHEAREMCRHDCEFYSHFTVDADILKNENIVLRFHGLDTLCDIFLNNIKIGETENMHRTYDFACKKHLEIGDNKLLIHFKSPIRYIEEAQKRHKIWGNVDSMDGIAHIRKASYMFGWDWGPQLPDMGIFRDVELICYNDVKIENINIVQYHQNDKVTLDIILEGKGNIDCCFGNVTVSFEEEIYTSDFRQGHAVIIIEDPKLWWPNGYGKQNLYLVSAVVNGEKTEKRIGLRTLTVSTEKDKYGEEFCFVVNGVKIFAMGANYVPQDTILSRIKKSKIKRLINSCVNSNFNCIRVWGGGYYPGDDFYDLCDEYGLIVWQDFMFACINIYLSVRFEENIKAEAIDNIKRIRHHASLGLLCGNNEMELFLLRPWIGNELVKMDYLKFYERILPDVCFEYAPQIFYWPASPSCGGGLDNPNDENRGDAHYWDVWHGDKSFTTYRKHYFRFCSEFGFESFPCIKTIKSFAEEKDMNPFSKVMENHQKCKSGNAKILKYAAQNYLYATSFEHLIYISQLNQANAIKYGVEHFRRFRGRCMGAVYWQLNDCWPAASWASLDYYGRWKALHYSAKKFFAPILLSAHENGFEVTLNISNETMEDFCGTVSYAICDCDFNVFYENSISVKVNKLSSEDIATDGFAEFIEEYKYDRFLSFWLKDKCNSTLSQQTLLFVEPKHFNYRIPNIKVNFKKSSDEIEMIIESDNFVQGLEIDFKNTDLILSDNYFDIVSRNAVKISAKTNVSIESLKEEIQIKTVNETR